MGEITFNANENDWAIKINDEGIKFNLEKWPASSPDDFARAFIEILELNYDVKFTRKEK